MRDKFSCSIAFNWHDSSIAISNGRQVLAVLEAERVFRRKKMCCNKNEMEKLVQYGLSLFGKTVDDVAYWALGTLGNPFLDSEQKQSKPPFWTDVNLFGKTRRVFIVNHHLAHAAAFLYSPKQEALVLTCDGGGDFGERVTAYKGNYATLEKLDLPTRNYVTAKLYDLCSSHLYLRETPTADPWLRAPRAEGKMMALAAYGVPRQDFQGVIEELAPQLCSTSYLDGYKILLKAFPSLLGGAYNIHKEVVDFAATVHDFFVRQRFADIFILANHFHSNNLVLSGGSNLNLELNTRVWECIDRTVFIPPCCDDTGEALGALAVLISEVYRERPKVTLPYLGQSSGDVDTNSAETYQKLCDELKRGGLVLIHNGPAEIGPRALGNRSFIARPDNLELKRVLSEKIKCRESYRPLAPVVLEELAAEYFQGPDASQFMLFQYGINPLVKDTIPAAIHVDETARVQTINHTQNPFLYSLIKRFGDETGTYVLLNTSLNLHGEPLSNTIKDTLRVSDSIAYPHVVVYNGRIVRQ